jgi:hypothetical protein
MQKRSRKAFLSTPRGADVAHRDENEIALLAEFMRHDSVASLAGQSRAGWAERQGRRSDRPGGSRPEAGRSLTSLRRKRN